MAAQLAAKLRSAFTFPSFKSSWRAMDKSQKASLVSLLALVFVMPLFLLAALNQTYFKPRASEPVTPPSPTPVGYPINWQTEYAGLSANSVNIAANTKRFVDQQPNTTVSSDPGSATYTTLETIWYENGQEMRVFIYFAADTTHWWVTEIRTYGAQDGSWIYYTQNAPYFKTPLGQAYTTNINLTSDSSNPQDKGKLVINSPLLWAFESPSTPPPGTPTPPSQGRNNPPVITTATLPNGQVGVAYGTFVSASDADTNEALSMTYTTLPSGLAWGPCALSSGQTPTLIQCTIQGTPTSAGRYPVTITVSDDQGANDTKTFNLTIQ